MAGQPLAFGPYRLDPGGVLLRNGLPIPLGRRALRLLECLLQRRGQVASKAELIDAAWPGEAVEESNLSVQIAQLRKALGGDWIRTVERVGYRMLAETRADRDRATPRLLLQPLQGPGAAEITDDITTALARFGAFRVLAFPGVADYVLEGSIRRDGGTIALRLAETRTGVYCWAERFDVRDDPDTLVGRIAAAVDRRIELAEIDAVQRERPDSEAAPDLYRRAQRHLNTELPEDNLVAAALLERALAVDPDNSMYVAAMCQTLAFGISMGWPLADTKRRCLFAYATHGLQQPVCDAASLSAFGFGIFRSGDPDWGYDLMQRAIALNPHGPGPLTVGGNAAMHWGALADAESYFRRTLSLSQHSPSRGNALAGLARLRMIDGRFGEALALAKHAVHANPHYGGVHWTLIAANAHLGHAEESAVAFDRFQALHPNVTISAIRAGQPSRARLESTIEGLDRAGMARH